MNWYEVRLFPDIPVRDFYEALPSDLAVSAHHFWDEPWWPRAFVIRVRTSNPERLKKIYGVDHVVPWDAEPDRRLFGEYWPSARAFFQSSSVLSLSGNPDMDLKLVHCFLNARGMSERDEARFAARMLWERLTIKLRWRLYLKRRWEREARRSGESCA
jgi:hypothetical protein